MFNNHCNKHKKLGEFDIKNKQKFAEIDPIQEPDENKFFDDNFEMHHDDSDHQDLEIQGD